MMIEDDLKFEVSKLLEDVKACDLRIGELEQDAARYRWLRENADEVHAGEQVEWVRKYGSYSPELDAAIDSALKSRP